MKVLLVGSGGRLGAALARSLSGSFDIAPFDHRQLDLGDLDAVRRVAGELNFDVAINCAALTNVDQCETDRAKAFAINADAPRVLAEICARKNAKLIHISTDYVFDGGQTTPYREEDIADPISVYGESKRAGEQRVLAVDPAHLVVRVSWIFGPERPSFLDGVIESARTEDRVEAIADKFSGPTYTADLAAALPDFLPGAEHAAVGGLLHYCNDGACSWQEYAQHGLDCCREAGMELRAHTVAPMKLAQMDKFIARRPVYSVLAVDKFSALAGKRPRHWRDAVRAYIGEHIAKS